MAALGPAPSKLVCLYANVEYLTQLHTLLEYARTLLETGEAEHLALRLFAIFPVGSTKAALTQKDITESGGELLTLHGYSCYESCRVDTGWAKHTAMPSSPRLPVFK